MHNLIKWIIFCWLFYFSDWILLRVICSSSLCLSMRMVLVGLHVGNLLLCLCLIRSTICNEFSQKWLCAPFVCIPICNDLINCRICFSACRCLILFLIFYFFFASIKLFYFVYLCCTICARVKFSIGFVLKMSAIAKFAWTCFLFCLTKITKIQNKSQQLRCECFFCVFSRVKWLCRE